MPVVSERLSVATRAKLFASPLVAALDASGRATLEGIAQIRHVPPGAAVFTEGDREGTLLFLARGEVSLERAGGEAQRVDAGAWFGDEALLDVARRHTARALCDTEVVSMAVSLIKRITARASADAVLLDREVELVHVLAQEFLAATTLGASLSVAERHHWASRSLVRRLVDGQALYCAGDTPRAMWLVISGRIRLETAPTRLLVLGGQPADDQTKARLGPGTLFGSEDLVAARPRSLNASAEGTSVFLGISAGELIAALAGRPDAAEQQAREERAVLRSTSQQFPRDRRQEVARSLLLIDQQACVQCGHCVDRCAARHGVPRLSRDGEPTIDDTGQSWLAPRACHHCDQPLCLDDCPTGAIERSSDGRVTIRATACTGCGACVKACTWKNIELAPRALVPQGDAGGDQFPLLAVKCDLCDGHDEPACVTACPTEAIQRLDTHTRKGSLGQRATPASWPRTAWLLVAVLLSLGVYGLWQHARGAWFPGQAATLAFGAVSAACMLGAFAHGAVKRHMAPFLPRPATALPWHFFLGAAALAALLCHAGGRISWSVAGLAQFALWTSVVLGAAGAYLYRVLPPRYAALVSDDEAVTREAQFEKLHHALSGTSDEVKRTARQRLLPYACSRIGPLLLLLSGRPLAAERSHLAARSPVHLRDDPSLRLVLAVSVAIRAASARRLLRGMLAAWLPLHIIASVLAVVLVVIHIAAWL
jgi:Fe-S-cluster-containing dehydrogenase component